MFLFYFKLFILQVLNSITFVQPLQDYEWVMFIDRLRVVSLIMDSTCVTRRRVITDGNQANVRLSLFCTLVRCGCISYSMKRKTNDFVMLLVSDYPATKRFLNKSLKLTKCVENN